MTADQDHESTTPSVSATPPARSAAADGDAPISTAPEPHALQHGITEPTWEDDETTATLLLRAAFTLVAGCFLGWAQWNAPIAPALEWGRWVASSVVSNLVLPVGIIWFFFGQTLTRQAWMRDQKHNAWNYGWNLGPWLRQWKFTLLACAVLLQHLRQRETIAARRSGRILRRRQAKFAQQMAAALWRHLKLALLAWLVMLPFLFYFSRQPHVQANYAGYLPPVADAGGWIFLLSTLILYMFCWEFFFRGFLLFGLAQGFGWIVAVVLQAVIFGCMHYGKPPEEMYSAFAGGLVLGAWCWPEKSFAPAFYVHALVHVTFAVLVKLP